MDYIILYRTCNLSACKRIGIDNSILCFSLEMKSIMGKFLYIIAFLLALGWAIGFFAFHFGAAIHILLVIALVIIIMRFFGQKNAF